MSVVAIALPVAFGVLIGILLGLVGGGGSILTVPILVYIVGLSPHDATATSLVIVGATALSSVLPHMQEGRVQWRTALLFGAAGIAGAFLGAWANRQVSGPVMLLLFGVLMLVVAARMALGSGAAPTTAQRSSPHVLVIPLAGLAVGVLTGFFGVGGGFVIVPALVLWLGLPMRIAIGTSLVIIALNSVSGALAHHGDGGFNWLVAALFIAGGLLGGQIGARGAGHANETWLKRGFAGMMVAVALFLIASNAEVVWTAHA